MRYAISYISTADQNLSQGDITTLFKRTLNFNNNYNITGLLIHSEVNFFQFIEGEKDKIINLYCRIETDRLYKNLIKFIEKPVSLSAHPGYICEFKTENSECNIAEKINFYTTYRLIPMHGQPLKV